MDISGQIGQIYMSGIWSVKPGNEASFIATWEELAEQVAKHVPEMQDRVLLQDLDKPQRFVTFGPWEAESFKAWLQSREGQEIMTKLRALCEEDQQLSTLKSVAYVSSKAKV